jgi:hypothetical protein
MMLGLAGMNAYDLNIPCWYEVVKEFNPLELARAATLNSTCRRAAYDGLLWSGYFKKWSPEYCVSSYWVFSWKLPGQTD